MVNVTLWPDTWARLRAVVRRHALLLVDGDLQREGSVVNVVAHEIQATPRGGGARPAVRSGPTASARPATPGCAGSADRGDLALDAAAFWSRLRPRPAVAACSSPRPARPRFGFDSCRNRRYHAAPAANSAPRIGDSRNAGRGSPARAIVLVRRAGGRR